MCTMIWNMDFQQHEPRLVVPADLIGAGEAANILGITKPTLTRRIASGAFHALAKLDGPRGVYVFDRNDVESARNAK